VRINVLIKRSRNQTTKHKNNDTIVAGDVVIENTTKTVSRQGNEIMLTPLPNSKTTL